MTDMTPGTVVALGDRVRRIVAPNPGVMTGPGTNTYLVGTNELVVIDPGPDIPEHLDAVVEAGAGRIRWIVVTHTHPDHSPGAAPLRERLGDGVEVLGFAERDGFQPDRTIGEGDVVGAGDLRLEALHTPGHAGNHLCFLLDRERVLFSGDHIMSGSTVVIGPPDGDMSAYLTALGRVRKLDVAMIAPGHGDVIADADAKIGEYVAHRLAREEAVARALVASGGPATIGDLLPAVYADVSDALHPIARMSLWAHLRKLVEDGRATADDVDDAGTRWTAVGA